MKLSKSVMYAINWLHSNGKDIDTIAEDLRLKKDEVVKYLEKHSITNHDPIPVKKSSSRKSSADLMIRHTRDKKTNNVSIMTKEASELNDELKKKMNSKPKNNDCIFIPRKNG